nr:DNA polymerase epsilon catalytic subunit A-like [Ipomoea trifida]
MSFYVQFFVNLIVSWFPNQSRRDQTFMSYNGKNGTLTLVVESTEGVVRSDGTCGLESNGRKIRSRRRHQSIPEPSLSTPSPKEAAVAVAAKPTIAARRSRRRREAHHRREEKPPSPHAVDSTTSRRRHSHYPPSPHAVAPATLAAGIASASCFAAGIAPARQILWISDNGIPDLGGTHEEASSFTDEVNQPVLIYPGAYRKVTIELKLLHLAVNALLKSNQVNEMEGGTLFGFEQDLNPNIHVADEHYYLDETTSSAPAFRVLKQLIQSPQSRLHDSALHNMLYKVMQKVFALLVAELRKLGAKIVFASFSKIIVDTGKSDLSAAKAYCDNVIKTLQTRLVLARILKDCNNERIT